MSYRVEVQHNTEQEFVQNPAGCLSRVYIKGEIITIHNEDGPVAHLVPDWMMKDFIKQKLQPPGKDVEHGQAQ